ncbi:MAG: DUF3160 domain-containing protein [Candidatus Thermoplasmatota archaeon]|nr:DUF3160 domain-containing protein [Candidatus Thermoplasmatota archaeon]
MGKKKKVIGGLLIIILFGMTSLSGCLQQQGPSSNLIIIPSVSTLYTDNPKQLIASYYSSEEITIDAQPPQYTLPLDLLAISNLNDLDEVFALSNQQKELLRTNGFFIRAFGDETDIVEPYTYLKNHAIPIFVTSDTVLHLYHILFDQTLKGIEEREFFDSILSLSKAFFDTSKEDYESFTDPLLKEAARRNVCFFGVALMLLQTPSDDYNGSEDIKTVSFSIPAYANDNVTNELACIEAFEGFEVSSIFHYKEDYSQYKPRGHYTQSEKLKRYFKTMMWYGRVAFLLRGSDIIKEIDATIATIQACLISTRLASLTTDNEPVKSLWEQVYAVTAFFVGTADDLIPSEYLTSIKTVFGTEFNATEFVDEAKRIQLAGVLAQLRSPQIYGGTGNVEISPPFTKEQLAAALEKTKGMRLMGQRFVPDSYMFQQLVFPTTGWFIGDGTPFTCEAGQRVMPRGLDIMLILGSLRAREHLDDEGDTAYEFYDRQIENLSKNFSSLNVTEWNRNLYWSWLYSLKSLLEAFDTRYPSFMQTNAWRDKELQTALASWTELRHDTILYAKQSYTPRVTSIPPEETPVVGYVEPVPEFYQRILSLTTMTRTGLGSLQMLNETESYRFSNLETILNRLLLISTAELEGRTLNGSDYEFIRSFGEQLEKVILGVNSQGKEITIIADVHTDTNSGMVLEEAVGYVQLILVAYKCPDGQIIGGAGPVFSYYEFKQSMSERLTDEEWNQMLQDNQQPNAPEWTQNVIGE